MRYGCISIEKGSFNTDGERVINIGDDIQLLAIMNLYKEMGIEEEEIIRIEYYDLFSYDGEEVVLPINFIWFNPFWGEKKLILSPKIHPVFLGIHSIGNDYDDEEIEYLKANEPIGCRDAYTYRILKKRDIDCYLHGCITSTLPRRKTEPRNGHVYMIDVQEELMPFIPNSIKTDAIILSHQYYGYAEHDKTWEQEALMRLNTYKDDASLVITSRLHCASPCMALGIPTIFAPAKKASSYSWINKIIPVYDKTQWSNIEWDAKPILFDSLKWKIIDSDIDRIKSKYEEKVYHIVDNMYDISDEDVEEYENGELMRIKQFTSEKWKKESSIKYAMWGVTQIAEHAYKHICDCYPNARLVGIFDNYRKIKFLGFEAKTIDNYDGSSGVYLFATGNSTSISARELFARNGWDVSYLCTCYEGLHSRIKGDDV